MLLLFIHTSCIRENLPDSVTWRGRQDPRME
jgi:hypothetical protein